jgi:hypothetical protein
VRIYSLTNYEKVSGKVLLKELIGVITANCSHRKRLEKQNKCKGKIKKQTIHRVERGKL